MPTSHFGGATRSALRRNRIGIGGWWVAPSSRLRRAVRRPYRRGVWRRVRCRASLAVSGWAVAFRTRSGVPIDSARQGVT